MTLLVRPDATDRPWARSHGALPLPASSPARADASSPVTPRRLDRSIHHRLAWRFGLVEKNLPDRPGSRHAYAEATCRKEASPPARTPTSSQVSEAFRGGNCCPTRSGSASRGAADRCQTSHRRTMAAPRPRRGWLAIQHGEHAPETEPTHAHEHGEPHERERVGDPPHHSCRVHPSAM